MKAVLPSDSWLAAACTVVQTITSLTLLCPSFPILLSEDHKSALSLLVLALSYQAISANKVGDDSLYFLQHFCVFLPVMCFVSNPPPIFSNFSFLRDVEHVLYSSHTYTLSGCMNVPTDLPIPVNQPAHPARPSPAGPDTHPWGPLPGPGGPQPNPRTRPHQAFRPTLTRPAAAVTAQRCLEIWCTPFFYVASS